MILLEHISKLDEIHFLENIIPIKVATLATRDQSAVMEFNQTIDLYQKAWFMEYTDACASGQFTQETMDDFMEQHRDLLKPIEFTIERTEEEFSSLDVKSIINKFKK